MRFPNKRLVNQPGISRQYLYGKATTHSAGAIEHAAEFGTDIAIRSAAPPPVSEYDAYLKSRNVRFHMTNHGTQKTGYRLRRIVVMRRQGASWKECGDAVGITAGAARTWVELLPLELAV